jgi:exopolysaccharide production protein ExoZ
MLINVQFLRFAAALLVVMYHASKHVLATGADQGFLFSWAERTGFAGVDVFFVISGFIMFYTTAETGGVAASVDFIKRRLARIYSGYWPFFILAAAVFAWARPAHFEAANLAGSFILWPMPLNHVLLDVSWTLSYEMYFYLAFTLLVLLGVGARRAVLGGMFLLAAGYNLYRHFVLQDFSPDNIYNHSFSNVFLTSPYLLEFLAGAVLASMAIQPGKRAAWCLLLLGVAGFFLAGAINDGVYGGNIEQGYHTVPRVLLFGTPSILIIWGLVGLEHNGAVAPAKFSLYTGGASYAIYLSHTIFFVATMKLGLNAALKGQPDFLVQAIYLLYCALIVALSVAFYRLPERRLHRAFKKILLVRRSG